MPVRLYVVALLTVMVIGVGHALAAPIDIAEIKRDGEVDFEKEILPIFRRNCLACHSATEAQSDLVLESPQTILKGGSKGQPSCRAKAARAGCSSWRASKKNPSCRRLITT